jgi:uncharacterized protein YlxW (UPF0749 family)
MKRFLIGLMIVVVCVAGVGLYRGWFQVTSEAAADQRNVTLSADATKIKADEKRVAEKVKSLGNQVKDKSVAPTEKSDEQAEQPARPAADEK